MLPYTCRCIALMRYKFHGIEGLGHIVVRPGVQPGYPVKVVPAVSIIMGTSDLSLNIRHSVSRQSRQHKVKDYKIVFIGVEFCQASLPL